MRLAVLAPRSSASCCPAPTHKNKRERLIRSGKQLCLLLAATLATSLLGTAAFAQANIAPTGTAYRWFQNTSATSNSHRVASRGLNDNNTVVDINLNGGTGETATLYEAGGVIWAGSQTIAQVQFISGTWTTGNDGAFCANLSLQTTTDGTTWTKSSWPVTPAFPYDSPNAAGMTFTFTGAPVSVLGVRVSGQAHCRGGNSDWENMREFRAFTPGAPDTTPPSAPQNLVATATSAIKVGLGWAASTDNVGVVNYLIFRNGTQVGTVRSPSLTFADSGLTPSTSYSYTVSAQDGAGNVSASSNVATVTTLPVSTSCTPDITIPQSGSRSWPDSCTTGASDSLGTLADVTGDITLDTPNQVYSNKRVNGSITVLACNVTIENVEVDAGVPFTGDSSTPDVFPVWLKHDPSCGVTLDHVSVITKSAPNNYVTNAIRNAYGSPVTISNVKIVGTQLGILTGPGIVRDSYIVLGPTMRGDHNEAILEDGLDGLTLQHNTFLNPNGQTSALSLFTEFGPNSNFSVDNNLLAGGGYTCYCGDGASDNNGNPARASNVSFTNNVFWRLYFPDAGNFAYGRAYNSAGGGVWTGNLYMNADGTLTTQIVPQPPIDQ